MLTNCSSLQETVSSQRLQLWFRAAGVFAVELAVSLQVACILGAKVIPAMGLGDYAGGGWLPLQRGLVGASLWALGQYIMTTH